MLNNIRTFYTRLNEVYNVITSGTLEQMLRAEGNSNAGVAVTPETAYNHSTVFACVRLLSDTIAQLPCKTFNKLEDGKGRKEASGNPLYSVLLYAPNPANTAFEYWKFNMRCLLLRGYYLSQIIYSTNGKVMELNPINPQHVEKIEKRRDGRIQFTIPQVLKDSTGNVLGSKKLVLVGGGGTEATAHYCYYATEDGIKPYSPITYNKEAIGLAMSAEKHGATLFRNDATPAMVVQVPGKLTVEAAKRLAETWVKTGSGSKYGMPRVLSGGATLEKITMSNEDAQYLETRKFEKQEIAGGIFGIGPHMVGEVTQSKGWSTLEQQLTEYLVLTLQPYATRIEQAIRRDLIPRASWNDTFVKFMTQSLMRGDTKTRMAFYKALFDLGALSPNEIRALEEMNAREDGLGDQYYVSANTRDPQTIENQGMPNA